MRPKAEITAEQYKEFYHHVGHAWDDPWLTVHWRAEGKIEYASLLFVPTAKPFDLYHPERPHGVKLYVRRVFITERCEGLVPGYLRFLRGIVDSEDLPLNLSREMLQNNPVLSLIRSGVVKRVLGELDKKAKDAPEDYAKFWGNFGAVLKEGLYEDSGHRDELLALARFRSTAGAGLVSLADYVGRMKEGQNAAFYIAGEDAEALAKSPHLEGFKKRGVEVLLFEDAVDEFWVNAVGKYQDKPFKSATRGGAEELAKIPLPDGEQPAEKKAGSESEIGGLIAFLKLTLQDAVKDVRASERLTDSAVCLVADDKDMDIHLERMLRQHRQLDQVAKRILEVNADHALIRRLAAALSKEGGKDRVEEMAHLLLDQARILEGDPLPDPAAYAKRMTAALERGL
jgi:molecular chaperone HtpG